jgi:hypothetical protein
MANIAVVPKFDVRDVHVVPSVDVSILPFVPAAAQRFAP